MFAPLSKGTDNDVWQTLHQKHKQIGNSKKIFDQMLNCLHISESNFHICLIIKLSHLPALQRLSSMRSNSLQWISLIRTSVHRPSSHYTSLHCISLPNIPVQCTLVQNIVLHCTSHSVFHLRVSVLYFTGQFFCSVHGTAILTWKNGNYCNSDLAIMFV